MKTILSQAKQSYDSLARFRKNRNRCRDYTFGRQWNDMIEVDGHRITEYEYIIREGNIPLKNNLIRRIVRNVLGVFRKQLPEFIKKLPDDLKDTVRRNSLEELYCRTMEEFLISGMAVHRKHLGTRDGIPGIWTDMVSPSNFFFNADSKDVRGFDVNLIGQFHDVDFRQWCANFVSDPLSYQKAAEIFRNNPGKVRVTEVWRREQRPRYLLHDESIGKIFKVDADKVPEIYSGCRKRWLLDDVWRYYFITEDGALLKEGDSPYLHGSHPFIFRGYPFLDGEIQSFVGDMLDQQRYANRLITLYDWVIRASAKGVLMIPEGAVHPDDVQMVANQWGRFNGVIVYKSQPGVPDPHQVNGNIKNVAISELLEIQLKMLEDVSGVNGALRGNLSSNGMSGTLYNQQTENAMTSLSDILGTFTAFMEECTRKDLSLLSQFQSTGNIT